MNTSSENSADKLPFDPLLECLVTLTKLHGKPISVQALRAGLPLVNNRFTPKLFLRAASRVGLSTRIVKRKLHNISDLVLPVVLLLNDNRACIVTQFFADQTAEVILPEAGEGSSRVPLDKLQADYTGYVIFAQPVHHFESRADQFHLEKPKSWFWGTIWLYRKNYLNVILASVLVNIFVIANPLFVMNVYDRVVPNQAYATLWVLAIGVSIAFFFDYMLRILRGYLIDISGRKADTLLSSMLFQQVLGLRLEYKPTSTGAFANHLQGFEAVREFFTSATLASLVDLPFIFLFLWVIYFIGGIIVLVPLIAVPVVLLIAVFLEVPMRKEIEISFFGATQKHALLIETLANLETVKTLSAESERQKKWERYVSMVAKSAMKSRFYSSLVIYSSTFILQMVTVFVVVLGVYLFGQGELSLGGLIACVILSSRALAPLTQVASLITRYQQSKMGLQSLNQIMKMPTERPPQVHFLHRPEFKGAIEFERVMFRYPNQENKAINDVSFTIHPQEKVAILGRIGSGKSSLLKLILGLYKVEEGAVRLDNTDSSQIDPADVRHNIGYVAQSSLLFYGTLRDNILKSAPWSDDAVMLRAAEIAGVDKFAVHHPMGFDMQIGEQGEGLSGGQAQSIAIARALVTDPQILLFDEPSSLMDNNTESELIQRLATYTKDKTLLIVTHKVSMLALVSRIIIIDEGKVVADGPKDKILSMLGQTQGESTMKPPTPKT
jgi:ATP-binding cassette, subfamily C, bacterial LapB